MNPEVQRGPKPPADNPAAATPSDKLILSGGQTAAETAPAMAAYGWYVFLLTIRPAHAASGSNTRPRGKTLVTAPNAANTPNTTGRPPPRGAPK